MVTCRVCDDILPEGHKYKACDPCLEYMKTHRASLRALRREQGLCPRCGTQIKTTHKTCKKCRTKDTNQKRDKTGIIQAWYFCRDNNGPIHRDGSPVECDTWLHPIKGSLELCFNGYHASIRALDSLSYAKGSWVSRVLLSGKVLKGDDKICASKRKHLWVADATEVLQEFARWCAIQVAEKWECPPVVKQYITGNDELRADAYVHTYNFFATQDTSGTTVDVIDAMTVSLNASLNTICPWDIWRSSYNAVYWANKAGISYDVQNSELERRLFLLER